ncbi:MAG: hypothetical protein OEQ18_14520, partial [Gammaproteobacteria bacterium]|nr:hypothetical protein [Gammaproteobacteria bacterium]
MTDPIEIEHPLTIRAANGYQPVIQSAIVQPKVKLDSRGYLLRATEVVVLEGLELAHNGQRSDTVATRFATLISSTAPMFVSNCRIHGQDYTNGIHTFDNLTVNNSMVIAGQNGAPLGWWPLQSDASCNVDNSILVGGTNVAPATSYKNHAAGARFSQCTLISSYNSTLIVPLRSRVYRHRPPGDGRSWLDLDVRETIFDGKYLLTQISYDELLNDAFTTDDVQMRIARWFPRRGSNNLYKTGVSILGLLEAYGNHRTLLTIETDNRLESYQRFLGRPEPGSTVGVIRYTGGDLQKKAALDPEELVPDDFRLRPDSAGFQTRPDGKDIGANVDLVGPGAAYERWKKTDEYQQWQKETRELIAASVTQQQQPFVVLSGQGNEVARFVTLTDAVLGSSPGDTIEIRGNGPFVTGRLEIIHPLTIRAGEGLRPVFQSDSNASFDHPDRYWIRHSAPLVLEGLHLTFSSKAEVYMLLSESRLMMANCHLLLDTPKGHTVWSNGDGQLQNNMIVHGSGADVFTWTDFNTVAQKNFSIKNDIHLGRTNRNDFFRTPDSLYIQNSTIVGRKYSPLAFWVNTDLQNLTERRKEILSDLVVSSSVIDCSECSLFDLWFNNVDSSDHERIPELALKLLSLKDRGNVWAQGSPLLNLVFRHHIRNPRYAPDMPSWQNFWKAEKGSSSQGVISFEAGKVYAKWQADPASLKPDDFRLTAKSAGYQAGPDGKDLGAGIDFVGPGAAYERWKQTPEYQQWQKET